DPGTGPGVSVTPTGDDAPGGTDEPTVEGGGSFEVGALGEHAPTIRTTPTMSERIPGCPRFIGVPLMRDDCRTVPDSTLAPGRAALLRVSALSSAGRTHPGRRGVQSAHGAGLV